MNGNDGNPYSKNKAVVQPNYFLKAKLTDVKSASKIFGVSEISIKRIKITEKHNNYIT